MRRVSEREEKSFIIYILIVPQRGESLKKNEKKKSPWEGFFLSVCMDTTLGHAVTCTY